MNHRYLYLHGFQSGPQSLKTRETGAYLQQHEPAAQCLCPQLSPYPARAIAQLQQLVEQWQPTVLIGSSLGGFYATHLAERYRLPAVLVNPSVSPERSLASWLGPLHNPYSGEDYVLGTEHMAELVAIRPATLHPGRYWLVLGTADEVLDWRVAARHYAGARQTILGGDDHRLQRWPQQLPQLAGFVRDYYSSSASSR